MCFTHVSLLALLDLCVSSLRRGHANLICIVPILTDDPRRESDLGQHASFCCYVVILLGSCYLFIIIVTFFVFKHNSSFFKLWDSRSLQQLRDAHQI